MRRSACSGNPNSRDLTNSLRAVWQWAQAWRGGGGGDGEGAPLAVTTAALDATSKGGGCRCVDPRTASGTAPGTNPGTDRWTNRSTDPWAQTKRTDAD